MAWSLRAALNTPWELQLNAVSPEAYLDIDAFLAQRLSLRVTLADGGQAFHSGIVTAATAADADGGLSR